MLVVSEDSLPPFDLLVRCYINHYLKKINCHLLPQTRWKYLVMVIEFFHLLIGYGIFTFGLLLPPDYLPYNVFLVTLVLLGWEMLGYCLVTKIVSQITGENYLNGDLSNKHNSRFVVPFSQQFLKLYGMFIVGLSIFFHMKPKWSPLILSK